MITCQRCDIGVLTEPAQAQHRLPEAGQRPRTPAGTASTPFSGQQTTDLPGQFTGHVEHGTIGNHVESFDEDHLWRDAFYQGLHAQIQNCPLRTFYPCRPDQTTHSANLGEITSLPSEVLKVSIGQTLRRIRLHQEDSSYIINSRPTNSREEGCVAPQSRVVIDNAGSESSCEITRRRK